MSEVTGVLPGGGRRGTRANSRRRRRCCQPLRGGLRGANTTAGAARHVARRYVGPKRPTAKRMAKFLEDYWLGALEPMDDGGRDEHDEL